jgi:hypothetical protein
MYSKFQFLNIRLGKVNTFVADLPDRISKRAAAKAGIFYQVPIYTLEWLV